MGYTHYWERPAEFEAGRFAIWVADVRRILANLPAHTDTAGGYHHSDPLVVTREYDDPSPAIATDDQVCFNGNGDMGHETFYVPRVMQPASWQQPANDKGWYFEFCKTARKPYDLAVTAALVRLAYHFPEGCTINSDGWPEEWEAGRRLCEDLFGFAVVPFSREASPPTPSPKTVVASHDDLPRPDPGGGLQL